MAKNKYTQNLVNAVLNPRKPNALKVISEACANGADVNGLADNGNTLLTQAIHDSASRAAEVLLANGADVNLADQNGWTPWMASTVCDETKRARIQALLIQNGASKIGDHIGNLIRSIVNADATKFHAHFKSQQDLKIISTFRVDLVRYQINHNNLEMLQLLLNNNMIVEQSHLACAVRQQNIQAVKMILNQGIPPEKTSDNETLLMVACSLGNLELVKILVNNGADVNRFAYDNVEWTAVFYARQAGHKVISDWLLQQMNTDIINQQNALKQMRPQKFAKLFTQATASETHSTEDLVKVFNGWDKEFNLSVQDAAPDRVKIFFEKIPKNIEQFFEELERLCPEVLENRNQFIREFKNTHIIDLWWD